MTTSICNLAKNLNHLVLAFALLTTSLLSHSQTEADLWNAIKSEDYVVLMRHSSAPGTGDPSNFEIDDCSTQRNLSNSGREQAKRIGDRFRENGIDSLSIYSSPWCRCIDTAELLKLGEVNNMMSLSSFYQGLQNTTEQNNRLRQWLAEQSLASSEQPTLLITHQVNITALTGVYPVEGQLVIVKVLKNGDLDVLGSIKPN